MTSLRISGSLTLELRVTGGSDVVMAPQYGNELGTCSIEVLTTLNADQEDWARFVENVIDAWSTLSDAISPLIPDVFSRWSGRPRLTAVLTQTLRRSLTSASGHHTRSITRQ